jgi:hypothetical protein
MERDDRGRARHQRRRVEIADDGLLSVLSAADCVSPRLAGIRSEGWRARALSARGHRGKPACRSFANTQRKLAVRNRF